MKNIISILKGILLWAEILLVTALILSVDSITIEAGIAMLITAIFLGIVAYNVITFNELVKLSGYRWFYKTILNKK